MTMRLPPLVFGSRLLAPARPRQHFLAAALLAAMSIGCGDDSSGTPANTSDASTQPGKDAATATSDGGAGKSDAAVPVQDAAASTQTDAAGLDAATAGDAATGADASTGGGDAGSDAGAVDTIPTFNGCDPGKYVDLSAPTADRTIAIAPAGARVYTPACITIAAGQKVKWSGTGAALQSHPLAPGSSPTMPTTGSPGSPIVAVSMGNSVEYTFPTAGTYPYICSFHYAAGMAGSVHVK
ncbi:MAG: Poly(3-hydroxyalkanoate) depolymerase [Myxococcaceae bacterium]|nr:Poly(3-hydroxyalkanoate) depolymerase [Myxococcaceae bacterium]